MKNIKNFLIHFINKYLIYFINKFKYLKKYVFVQETNSSHYLYMIIFYDSKYNKMDQF